MAVRVYRYLCSPYMFTHLVVVWHSFSALASNHEVNLHQTQLVLGWVTGFNFRCRAFVWFCNQPSRST